MSSSSSFFLVEPLAKEIAIIMLESPARNKYNRTKKVWDYMETYLCCNKDYHAFVCYLKGEA